ncbi:MAG: hypothetical protein QOC89_1655 [Paraburkholderia sp.]|nr:hypothetical protein [Paraburkholderia sp.]
MAAGPARSTDTPQQASHVFGIESLGKPCRINQIDEHHRELPSLGVDNCGRG